MKNIVFIFLFTLTFPFITSAQTDKLYSETLREASEYILEEDYNEALYILQDLERKGYTYPNVDFWMGFCYLNAINKKEQAIGRLESAAKQITPSYDYYNYNELKAPSEACLYLGDAYLANNQPDLAKVAYQKYLTLTTDPTKKEITYQRLKDCVVARIINNVPPDGKLENAGNIINNGLINTNACISGDGNSMVFLRKLKFYDAIFYTTKDDKGWAEPVNITSQTGSDGNFIPTGLDFDGKKMLLQSYSAPYGYNLYESSFDGVKWSKIRRFTPPINTPYDEVDATYTADGQSIIFSSSRPEGAGGFDLYIAKIGLSKDDITIQNLGSPINTPNNEKSPMLLNNDSTLVYNADILYGMGGYDYYHSHKQSNGNWSVPYNLGRPFNTTDNDSQLKLATKKNEGVIVRTDPSGYNDLDILFLSYNTFGSFKFVPVTGTLEINGKPAFAQGRMVYIIDNDIHDTVDILTPDPTGTYSTSLYPGNFNVIVKNNDTIEHVQKIEVPRQTSDKPITLVSNIETAASANIPVTKNEDKPEIKSEPNKPDTLFVSNILFAFNKAELTPNEAESLVQWLIKLKAKQIKFIHLTGYADAIGSKEYNMKLSLNRAKTIKNMMVNHGIPASIIDVNGKGSAGFVAPNQTNGKDNPHGRALNRRVEIKLQINDSNNLIIKYIENTVTE
ncbi:MAG TPA: OmpA family protein [Bacteroidales bacterium]|nr:OmpA family protein [Bacteroidales bacterium]